MDWNDLWCEKYRPVKLEDVIMTAEISGFMQSLKSDVNTKGIPNMLFSGPPGVGKTTLAKVIAEDILGCDYLYINGSEESSIEVVRTKIIGFAQTRSFDGKIKVVILDEADGLSANNGAKARSSAQQALKNVIEEYSSSTRFIFTTNHPERIIEAIQSRLVPLIFRLEYKDCLKRALTVLKMEHINIPQDQIPKIQNLVKLFTPDLRNILIQLQVASVSGSLDIAKVLNLKAYSKMVLTAIFVKKVDPLKLRESVIQNDETFNSDFHELLKGMFNSVLEDDYNLDKKVIMQTSLIISDSIVDHFSVSDKEINFSACLFRLSQIVR